MQGVPCRLGEARGRPRTSNAGVCASTLERVGFGDEGYDDAAAGQILTRAAQLQAAATLRQRTTLGELQQIGAEAGIDPGLVRRAAMELARRPRSVPLVRGMPAEVIRSRVLPGIRPRRRDLDRLATVLDRHFGAMGKARVLDSSLSWEARHIRVSVSVDAEGTSLEIAERFVRTVRAESDGYGLVGSFIAFGTTTVVAGGLLAMLGVTGSTAPFLTLGLGLAAAFPGAMAGVRLVRSRHLARLERVGAQFERALDHVSAELQGSTRRRALAAADAAE